MVGAVDAFIERCVLLPLPLVHIGAFFSLSRRELRFSSDGDRG